VLKTILTIRRLDATDGARFQVALFDRAGLLDALADQVTLPDVTDRELIMIGAQGNSTARLDQQARTHFISILADCLESISSGASRMNWSWSSRTGVKGQPLSDVADAVATIASDSAQLGPTLQAGEPLTQQRLDNGNSAFSQYCSIPLPPLLACRLLRDLTRRESELHGQGFRLEVEDGTAVATTASGKLVQTISSVATRGASKQGVYVSTGQVAPWLPELCDILSTQPNIVLEGVPGTGKSHAILALGKSTYGDRVTTVVMHPATGYEDLIEGVRPANGELGSACNLKPRREALYFHECYGQAAGAAASEHSSPFVVRAGHFLLACARACATPSEKFLLVLDEINRCNVPRAFGELLLLIEASKRWKHNGSTWVGEHSAVLPYSGLTFFVPDNLHVLGTMNTTDRSIAPLDQALRRRFAFHRLEPFSAAELKAAIPLSTAKPLLGAAIDAWHSLNLELEERLGPDAMLGHSYFFDAERAMTTGTAPATAIRDMWRLAVLPQLIDILHSANRMNLAEHAPLTTHLATLGLALATRGEGLHRLLRVKSDSSSPSEAIT
jgi:MoxR-like ATPase